MYTAITSQKMYDICNGCINTFYNNQIILCQKTINHDNNWDKICLGKTSVPERIYVHKQKLKDSGSPNYSTA